MKPEQLKVIAEGMGYEVQRVADGWVYVKRGGFRDGFLYSPDTTNNDQMVEIMEKLIEVAADKAILLTKDVEYEIEMEAEDDIYVGGKTINEAVCNAAFEYFK